MEHENGEGSVSFKIGLIKFINCFGLNYIMKKQKPGGWLQFQFIFIFKRQILQYKNNWWNFHSCCEIPFAHHKKDYHLIEKLLKILSYRFIVQLIILLFSLNKKLTLKYYNMNSVCSFSWIFDQKYRNVAHKNSLFFDGMLVLVIYAWGYLWKDCLITTSFLNMFYMSYYMMTKTILFWILCKAISLLEVKTLGVWKRVYLGMNTIQYLNKFPLMGISFSILYT